MAINFANNSSLANITSLPASISGGGLTLISSQTASASASLEFSIDSTYDSYVFKFINIHPSVENARLGFQASTNNGSSYGVTATTTAFETFHRESGLETRLGYRADMDSAQSTSFIPVGNSIATDNDTSGSGYLQIFNPSSTTFVKHFVGSFNFIYTHPSGVFVYISNPLCSYLRLCHHSSLYFCYVSCV